MEDTPLTQHDAGEHHSGLSHRARFWIILVVAVILICGVIMAVVLSVKITQNEDRCDSNDWYTSVEMRLAFFFF
jgi:hypothetical protein